MLAERQGHIPYSEKPGTGWGNAGGRADQNPGQFILSSLIPCKKGKLPDGRAS